MISVVLKIGGSLLRDGRSYINAAEKIKELFIEQGLGVVVVVSAMKGVTDSLIRAYNGSINDLYAVMERYINAASYIGGQSLVRRVREELDRLEIVFKSNLSRDNATRDLMLSFGERLSRIIMTEALSLVGVKAVGVDARDVIKTNSVHGNAVINYGETRKRLVGINALLKDGIACVIEGFIGSDNYGATTTLGRGGSDYTATTIAALLGLREVYLVTDVPGIMTCDPKYVSSPRIVRVLSYSEAIEASFYGGKRLHPRTFHPLINMHGSVVHIGCWDRWGTTIVKNHAEGSLRGPKLIAFKKKNRGSPVALVGEGVSTPTIMRDIIDYISSHDLFFEGLYMIKGRPSIVLLFEDKMLGKALHVLHNLVLEWGSYEV